MAVQGVQESILSAQTVPHPRAAAIAFRTFQLNTEVKVP
jgi:hypothetical protein